METFNLQLSCPSIISAPKQAHVWLENIFNSGLNQAILKRYELKYKITNDVENGPLFIINDINEQDFDKILQTMLSTISRHISSSMIKKYISAEDIQIEKKRNFDELVKKLPELKGIF